MNELERRSRLDRELPGVTPITKLWPEKLGVSRKKVKYLVANALISSYSVLLARMMSQYKRTKYTKIFLVYKQIRGSRNTTEDTLEFSGLLRVTR